MFGQFTPGQNATQPPNLFVGGSFTTFEGAAQNRLIMLNNKGDEYTSFDIGTGFNGRVNVVRVDADGKYYVGGNFTTYQGVTANFIIRLNPDGTKDNGFDNSTGFNDQVYDVRIVSGKIYVAGSFTSYKGTAANRIIRLNANGTKDTSFNNTTGFNDRVNQMAVYGSQIYCAGIFTQYKGAIAAGVARLQSNGNLDATFDSNPGADGLNVTDIAIDNNGKIYIAGSGAVLWNGTANTWQVTRLNTDGTADLDFNIGGPLIADGPYQLAIDPLNRPYVGGTFTTLNGTPIPPHLVKFDTSGDIDTSFNLGTSPNWGFNNSVWAVQYINGKVLVGGDFTTYKAATHNRFVVLNTDGTVDSNFNVGTGFNAQVFFIGR
jgi:uncharacterized delta-60 repeat protein